MPTIVKYLMAGLCPTVAKLLVGRPISAMLVTAPLTFLFWLPGMMHAIVILKEEEKKRDVEALAAAIRAGR